MIDRWKWGSRWCEPGERGRVQNSGSGPQPMPPQLLTFRAPDWLQRMRAPKGAQSPPWITPHTHTVSPTPGWEPECSPLLFPESPSSFIVILSVHYATEDCKLYVKMPLLKPWGNSEIPPQESWAARWSWHSTVARPSWCQEELPVPHQPGQLPGAGKGLPSLQKHAGSCATRQR